MTSKSFETFCFQVCLEVLVFVVVLVGFFPLVSCFVVGFLLGLCLVGWLGFGLGEFWGCPNQIMRDLC